MPTSAQIRRLAGAARKASHSAYAPYSKFRVGAAVLTSSGKIHTGCNVENASYGLTCCAERNAIFQAVSAGERTIEEVVIYTPTQEATAPCGACRQVISEFGPDADVTSYCDSDDVMASDMLTLLPHSFGPHNL